MPAQRFPIRIGARSRLFLRLWRVTADRAFVEVSDDEVHARFGFGESRVPLANIARWRIEGPWRWVTAIGIRRGIRSGDISFAGSPHGGVKLVFRERVPFGPFRMPALYIAVDDLEGFAAALAARGIPGEDGRKRRVP